MFKSEEKKAKEKVNKGLFAACQAGDIDNVRYWLDQGADINHVQKNETPLLVAATHKHSEVVRLLLKCKADYTVKNKKGKTATDIAKDNNDQKTKYILSSVLGDIRVFDLLEQMGLLEHWEKFAKEEVKFEDLQGYTEKDLEELGIPKGPRGRILHHFTSEGGSPAPVLHVLGQSDRGPRTDRIGSLRGQGLSSLNKGSSHSMTELPIGGTRSATLGAKRAPPEIPDRRSLPLTRYPTSPSIEDHYGAMPKLAPTSPQLENHYVSTPEFIPEPVKPGLRSVAPKPVDNGHYAAVDDSQGTEYAEVVDESEYVDGPDGTREGGNQCVYAAPPDFKSEPEPVSQKSDNDFDSSSYREINYSELILEEEIGRGAFGSVYRGAWRGAPVAIKKLHSFSISDPHMVAEFRREASMMQLVGNHPNIVKFVGACSKEEPYCLVSLFCSNGSLESFLKKEKLTPAVEAKMLMEIAAGVLHLHCEGVIHRDLAARNVLVGDNSQVYITDFGFARIKEAGNTFNTTKSTIGPVKYMAPESLKDKKYSEKTDAFSFGVVLWEILNPGKVPYEGEDLLKIAMAVITQKKRLAVPENANPVYKKLMQDCWEEDPDKRPNFQEIYKRLYDNYKELSSGKGGSTSFPVLTPPASGGGVRGKPAPPRGGAAPRGGIGAGRAKPAPERPAKPNPTLVEAVKPRPEPAPQHTQTQQPPQQPQQPQQPTEQQPPAGVETYPTAPTFPTAPVSLPTNYASYTPATTYTTYTHPEAYPPAYTPTPYPTAYTPTAPTGYAAYTHTPAPTYDYNAHYAPTYASYQPTYTTPAPSYAPTGYASYDHGQAVTNFPAPPNPYATYHTGGYATGYATLPTNYPN